MRLAAAWLALVLTAVGAYARADESACDTRRVDIGTLREALAEIDGYDTTATTNQSRFVADFLLRLADHPGTASDNGRFEVLPERFIAAWLEATGRSEDRVPDTMARVLEFDQRFIVDVSPDVRVDAGGPLPRRTLAVRVSWPAGESSPSHYAFVDTLSDPEVRVRHERVITYLLMDFGDWIAFERIEGVSARPMAGPRASLADLLGMADIRSTRLAVAADGLQLLRTEAHKLFRFTHLSTVAPDGTAERGVPRTRPDLEALAARLEVDLEIESATAMPEPCR